MELQVNLKLDIEVYQTLETIADRKNISMDQAVQQVLKNQSSRELLKIKDVERAVENIRKKHE